MGAPVKRLALLLVLSLGAAHAAAKAPPKTPTLTVVSRAVQRGEILLIAVEDNSAKLPPSATVRGRALEFFPAASTGTWLAFYGIDLDDPTGPAELRAVLRDSRGRPHEQTEQLTILAGKFPTEELKVAQRYVTPQKSDGERAESEAATLHGLFVHGEEKRLFEGDFVSPIPGAPTARFGERRVFNGQPRAPHSGMDLRAKIGTPVRAPAAGRVVLAGPLYFSGNTIVLDHGLGLTTVYAHLSKMRVRKGALVKKGQVIGLVGKTGRVTGPHLHWGLKFHAARVDPFSLVALDLDAYLKPRPNDPLRRSAACARADLPPAPKWGRARNGLRARLRPLKVSYAPGETLSLLVEIENVGRRSAFLDFVRDPAARAAVLGLNGPPRPYDTLASSATARLSTEQIKIPPKKILCFEQGFDADGILLARETTSYALTYGTEFLYSSTSTARVGIWRGSLSSRPADVVVSTGQP
jgi:murein DD-endopeptidase MepM/ murein hydrolase activator NlpD